MSTTPVGDEPTDSPDMLDRIDEHEELRRLLREEKALRNVAALVAAAGPSEDILTLICRETSGQLDGQEVSLLRFEGRDTIVSVATHGGPIPPGIRAQFGPGSLPEQVARTAMPVRVDDFSTWSDAELVSPFGIRAAVAVPVFVEGTIWGMCSASSQEGPLAAGTEVRLARFAQLTWAAVANTEARESLRRLADEQTALRHVAELVAAASPLPDVFDAVVEAAARLHSAEVVLSRRDVDAPGGERIVARAGEHSVGGRPVVSVPILIDDQPWGALRVSSIGAAGPISPDRPKAFADLIAAAVANAQHREKLTQSRSRVIAAGDEARRRLQRDVHDGAQQRLVHTIVTLKLARDSAAEGRVLTRLLAEALANAEEANQQLRDVVRGILPAALTRGGLAAGIRSLVADTTLPVELQLNIPRLPVDIETSAYFVAAEAITNAIKHSQASRLHVSVLISDADELTLTVEDDGIGGADPARGTGLLGLTDRVEAWNGTLTVASADHAGTLVTARIPLSGERIGEVADEGETR